MSRRPRARRVPPAPPRRSIPGTALRAGGRTATALVLAGLALTACENYLGEPGQGEPEAPVLENVVLSPATLTVLDAPGDLNTAVDARTRSGIDGVTVVLKSPSGNDRLSCDMSTPAEGDPFDGRWTCDLTVAQGSESGVWEPDSIGVFSSGAEGGVRYFTRNELADAGYEVAVEIISEPPVPTELTVAPQSAELPAADSEVTLVATVLDQYGREIPAAPVVWTSEDPAIAAVSGSGVVTPVSVGATEIVGTLDALSDTATIVVPSTPTTLAVTPASVALDSVGATAQLAVEVRNQFDDVLAGETVTWTSADPSVATVDATGLVTAVSGGVTTVQAEAAGLATDVLVTVEGGAPLPGFTWTNLAGGSWNDPANWDRGVVPGPADTAFVRLDGSYTVTVDANAAVGVLEVENAAGRPRLEVAAGTFTVADSAWFGPGSTAVLSAGRWDGSGSLVAADSLIWIAGFHSGAGATVITSGGTLAATGTTTATLDGRTLILQGQGVVDGGILSLAGGAELQVAAGATLEHGAASISAATTGTGAERLVVDGTLAKPDTGGDGSISARLVNNGQVTVGFGRLLTLSGTAGFEGGGEWLVQVDAVLRTTSSGEIGAGGRIRGAGTWENRGGGTILGSVDMDGGIDFGNPETVLRVESPDTVLVNNFVVDNGGIVSLDPAATIRVRNDFQLGPGPGLIQRGSLHLPVGTQGTINPTSGFSAAIGAGTRVEVGGLLTWASGDLALDQGAQINVTADGELALEADGTLLATGGTLGNPVIVSQGEITRAQGTGTATIQPDLTNGGVMTLRTGILDLDGGFTHAAGGLLRGIAVLDVTDTDPVSFQGEIGPGLDFGGAAGALTIQGNLALTGTSTLSLELAGTAAGTDADLLDVSGAFNAAGTLDVTGLSGYLPAAGDTIEVLRYGSRAGAFDAVTGLDFAVAGGGEPLDTVFEANRLLLVGPDAVAGDPTGVVVFGSSRTGSREIFVKDVETGAVTQLTSLSRFAFGPRVAPDGSRIVFADNADEILLINSDGSGLRSLTGPPGAIQAGAPAWSASGDRIAYQTRGTGEDWEIVTVSVADTTDRVQLTDNTIAEQYPDWSPDGARIVYVETDASNVRRIVSIRASDGGDRIEHFTGTPRYPRWSPDGTEIAFSNLTGNGFEIRVLDVATGDTRIVVPDGDANAYPSWSPTAEFLVYDSGGDLFYVPVTGGTPTLLESSAGFEQAPDWAAALTAPSGVPTASISSPTDGASFAPGESITFEGSATDPEDGALTGTSLVWSSSIDGGIGTGETLSTTGLSVGTHVITLTATDSQGNTGSDEINVTVTGTADAYDVALVRYYMSPDPVTQTGDLVHTVVFRNDGAQDIGDIIANIRTSNTESPLELRPSNCTRVIPSPSEQGGYNCVYSDLSATPLSPGAVDSFQVRYRPTTVGEEITGSVSLDLFDGNTETDFSDNDGADTTTVVEYTAPVTATITAPADGSSFTAGSVISFAADFVDAQGVSLTPGFVQTSLSVEWTSSLDGLFSTQLEPSTDQLSAGTHTITLRVLEGTTELATDQVTLTTEGPVLSVDLRGGIGARGSGAGFAAEYNVGDSIPMFFSVNNSNGPDTEPNPLVTITADQVVTPLGTLPANCATSTPGGTSFEWVCQLGPLGPFTGSDIVDLPFEPVDAGTLTLTFEITGDGQDTDLTNNTETETTEITAPPSSQSDLSLEMVVEPNPVWVGGVLTHSVTVSNAGPDAASGVEITVGLGGNVTLTAAGQEGCVDAPYGGTAGVRWNCLLGDLGVGETQVLRFRATADVVGSYASDASITASGGATDPTPGDQSVSTLSDAVPFSQSTEALYGVDSSSDALWSIDPVTLVPTRVGTNFGPTYSTPVALGVVPGTEEVLVWTSTPERVIGSVDVCTGTASVLGTFSEFGLGAEPMQGLAIRSDAVAFGFSSRGEVVRMNPPYDNLSVVATTIPFNTAGADFTPTGRLFAVELDVSSAPRLVEVDPVTGDVLQTFTVRDGTGTPVSTGVIGSIVWNSDTGQFLATSSNYQGLGDRAFDLSLDGVVSNPRGFSSSFLGGQGLAFRSAPTCGGP